MRSPLEDHDTTGTRFDRPRQTPVGGDGAVVGGRSTGGTAPPRFNRVNALLEIGQGVLRGGHTNRSPTELVVTVPVDVLLQPASADVPIGCMGDGTCVSAETVRRLSCDCGVVYLQEDAGGNTVSVGRKIRSISGALRRALLNRDRTCRFPGCSDRVFLEGHHIQHWADGDEPGQHGRRLQPSPSLRARVWLLRRARCPAATSVLR